MPFITRNDKNQKITIHYEVTGKGEPIVFHHGNGNSIKDWHTLGFVNELSPNFQLILIDSRGYGQSSKPHDPADYNLQSRAEDTIAVLDELKIEKVHCFGASIGAAMCLILAKYYPQRFKSFIFATPYFTQFDESVKKSLLQGPDAYVAKLEELLGSKISNELIRKSFLDNDAKAVWAANSSEWFNYLDYIKYIKSPSLIYVGSKEPSVRDLTELSKQLPNNQFKILSNIDHVQAYWTSKLVTPLIQNFIYSLGGIMGLGKNAKKFYEDNFLNEKTSNENKQDTVFDVKELRKSVDKYFRELLSKVTIPSDIKIDKTQLDFNGHKVEATIYTPPSEVEESMPVIIFHPGGGLSLNMADLHLHACVNMCRTAQAAVICIQPELSPERKLDEILQAAYQATKYFYQHADKYSFDQERFMISGYSMGGTIAMLITNQARQDKELKIAGQIIISGVLDIANPPEAQGEDFMFDPETHRKFVEMCLPKNMSVKDLHQSAFSPIVADLTKLPPTRLITGECDVFKGNTEKMTILLKKQSVVVETIIIPGQIHNTLLLYPVMGDNQDPAIAAGNAAKELCLRKLQITCRN